MEGSHPAQSPLLLNLAVRVAVVYWLAEAWVLQDDPRFAGKAIPERNTVIVGWLSLLFPAIWYLRKLGWHQYPVGLDILYLSIYAVDMAGNSFNLYDPYTLNSPGRSPALRSVSEHGRDRSIPGLHTLSMTFGRHSRLRQSCVPLALARW